MANARPHRPLRRLSDEDRARAVGRLEAGIPPQTVADHLMSIAVLLYDFVKVTGLQAGFPTDPGPEDQKLLRIVKTDILQ